MATNNFKILLTSTAKEELEEIYKYISEKLLEKNSADRLMNNIEQKIFSLEQNPYLGSKVCIKPHNETYRRLVVGNYIILYDIVEEYKQIIVYRLLHTKMDYLNLIEEIK